MCIWYEVREHKDALTCETSWNMHCIEPTASKLIILSRLPPRPRLTTKRMRQIYVHWS